jgi:NAD(P)H-nitrite reductase large subunit
MASQKHICIIGNGISGITAARNIRKLSDHKITVISSESKYFYSRTSLMYIYMGHMKQEHTQPYEAWFWTKNKIDLVHDYVEKIDFKNNEIQLKASQPIIYDELILATGSKPNKFGWPGQDLEGVSGLYSLQDLEAIENSTKNITEASIIGGGLIGIELAEMLISRKIKVNFLVREKHFWANILPEQEGKLIEIEIKKHGVNLLLNNELDTIIGTSTSLSNQNGKVISIKTKKGEIIPSQFVGLTVGVSPNISFLKNTDLETEKGILVDEYLKTNMPNVYAIGDCIEHKNPPFGRKSIEQIWYTGKIMGETLAKTICGIPTKYEPGIFYNSAKFFDIEYSVYGNVPAVLPKNGMTFFWENDKGNKCLRINYLSDSEVITGIHAFGIRLRAATCLAWIENKTKFKTVINELEKANFDPEFSKKYLMEISENLLKS